MGISPKLLSPGERVIVSTRTHWKVLILPVFVLIVTCAVAGFLVAVLPSGSAHPILLGLVLVVAAVVVIVFTVRRFVEWISATYTVTNRRIINRSGIVVRKGRDIPLQRINQVSYERGLLDRLFGCGTLVISDASEEGNSVLHDVPDVEKLQLTINDLLFGTHDGSDEDGTPKSALPPLT